MSKRQTRQIDLGLETMPKIGPPPTVPPVGQEQPVYLPSIENNAPRLLTTHDLAQTHRLVQAATVLFEQVNDCLKQHLDLTALQNEAVIIKQQLDDLVESDITIPFSKLGTWNSVVEKVATARRLLDNVLSLSPQPIRR